MSSHLLIGKAETPLADVDAIPPANAAFVNQAPVELVLNDIPIQRSIWINVSLKDSKISKCNFAHSTFVNCYFRGAILDGCDFTGCRFIDCTFPASCVIQRCDFQYTRWTKTDIRRSTLLDNLPSQANLAQDLLIRLRLNATSIGEYDDARSYLYEAEKRSREHFWEIILCRKDYYNRKYALSQERLLAPVRYLRSQFNHLLWGYGERPLVLTTNMLIFAAVLGSWRAYGTSIGGWEAFKLSLASFAGLVPSVGSGTEPLGMLSILESLMGLIYIAFLAASLHRRIATRRD